MYEKKCKVCNKSFYAMSCLKKYCSHECREIGLSKLRLSYIGQEFKDKKCVRCKKNQRKDNHGRLCEDCYIMRVEKERHSYIPHHLINLKGNPFIDIKLKLQRRMRDRRSWVRKMENKNFVVLRRLRSSLHKNLSKYTKTGKVFSSSKYGINHKAIIEHLKPFPENINEYHVDHIKPLCSFDLTNPNEVKKAFAPENHQWLLIEENLRKGGTF